MNNSEPRIYFIDQSYDNHGDLSEEEASDQERKEIETEFGVHVQPANIGSSADLPAFLLALGTPVALLVTLFFQGKAIKENFGAWTDIGRTIRDYFNRPVRLNREAALFLALYTYAKERSITLSEIQLVGYKVFDRRFEKSKVDTCPLIQEISPSPKEIYLGDIIHVFDVILNGTLVRFVIDGRNIKIDDLEE